MTTEELEDKTKYMFVKANHLVTLLEKPVFNNYVWNREVTLDVIALYREIGGKVCE